MQISQIHWRNISKLILEKVSHTEAAFFVPDLHATLMKSCDTVTGFQQRSMRAMADVRGTASEQIEKSDAFVALG